MTSIELVGIVLANADPVNAALLVAIYFKLRTEHKDAKRRIDSLKDDVASLEGYHEGDDS